MADKKKSPITQFKHTIKKLTDNKHDNKDFKQFKQYTTKHTQPHRFKVVKKAVKKADSHNNGGKGNGNHDGKGKHNGKGKGKKGQYYKQAKKAVNSELKPQFHEIQRYIHSLKQQRKHDVGFEQRLGNRTQNDLSAIFDKAGDYNTDQQKKIAQVMGQAQQGVSNTYGTTSQNIDYAYSKANETANETLSRLGITPVSGRLAEDQAWMQGLNEQNKNNAAQGLAAQQGIFAGAGGMLGMAISGEGATRMGEASTATAEAIRRARETANIDIGDSRKELSDLKKSRGSMINQAQQLLKQQAFEQMMEQAQLMALNKKSADEMKLNWAQLNETAQYHQGQLQNDSNRLALDKWKEQHDQWMDLHPPKDHNGGKLSGDLNGWGDARQFAYYKVGKKNPQLWRRLQPLFHSMQAGWGSYGLDVNDVDERAKMYEWSMNYIKSHHLGKMAPKSTLAQMINDMLSIGAGKY